MNHRHYLQSISGDGALVVFTEAASTLNFEKHLDRAAYILAVAGCLLMLTACGHSSGSSSPAATTANGAYPELPLSIESQCDLTAEYLVVHTVCDTAVFETPQGLLIASDQFTMPLFAGRQGGPSGSCVLAQNGDIVRGTLGDADYCKITISAGQVSVDTANGFVAF